jgi:nucleotide-binding universal stress UspA family protein
LDLQDDARGAIFLQMSVNVFLIMKKILVPTDFSETALTGLQLAVEIAKKCGASISLVNFEKHPYGPTFSATGDVMTKVDPQEDFLAIAYLKNAKARLDEIVAGYVEQGLSVEVAIVDNEFKNGMDEYLKSEHIDLVVMGTTGEENARETFTGNHAEQAIKVSACPVLSVRDGFNITNFNTIVIGVNVITDNKLADGLIPLRELADCFDAHVHLVHVREHERDPQVLLNDYFNQIAQIAGLKKYTVSIVEGEDTAETLVNYAHEVNAGFIALIKNSREGIFRIFSNKLSTRMVKEEGGPVVTVNLQNV